MMTCDFPEFDSLDYLKDDVELQKEYIYQLLKEYAADGNIDEFLIALKPLIKLHGTISDFAKKSGINRTYFYKLFNKQVKPEFSTIVTIISSLGFNLEFKLVAY